MPASIATMNSARVTGGTGRTRPHKSDRFDVRLDDCTLARLTRR
ncbi:hypothetical protein NJ7G_1504 [Natrinema sp. J7-2]|nr:hypothetical protein NJ7G_1504 [Natrinema sp. J7-2]